MLKRLGRLCWWYVVATGLVFASSALGYTGYTGFDCGQGNALLYLAGHTHCGPSGHLACYQTIGMKVKRCQVKLWPHKAQKQRPCSSISFEANVTDVNRAQGTLVAIMHGANKTAVPATLEFTRRDELMHLHYGSCVLHFNVRAASDAALQPVPGEEAAAVPSLLVMVLPAVLVPCAVIGLIMTAGRISVAHMRSSPVEDDSSAAGAEYIQLGGGPGSNDTRHNLGTVFAGLGLLTHGFNLKSMSRRARARRLRRNTRVVYVGPADRSMEQQQLYASGRLLPGPRNLIAPCFRFPPVAVPPALPVIPESCTPTRSSAATSRTSSYQDMSVAAVEVQQ